MSIRVRLNLKRGNFDLRAETEFPGSGITSLHGPSGSGKTTLLRTIAGLDRHPGAEVMFDKRVFQDAKTFLPPHQRSIGYVFQESSLFPQLDVLGNIEFGVRRQPRNGEPADYREIIEILDLGRLLRRRPESLSGGERRRVAIARALAPKPPLLLLDEPTAGLDTRRRRELLPYLENLHTSLRIPVIHVSHSVSEVMRLADHIVMLDSGRIIASGSLAEIQARLDLPMALDEAASIAIEARVIDVDAELGLASLELGNEVLTVLDRGFARGQKLRVSIAARDVSVSLSEHRDSSILNIFRVTLDAVSETENARVLLRLKSGDIVLLARITRKSFLKLNLAVGMKLFAQVKSVALLN